MRDLGEPTLLIPEVAPNYYRPVDDLHPVADALRALYAAHNAPPESWDHDHVRSCELNYRTERAKLVL